MKRIMIVPVRIYEESMEDAKRLAQWLDDRGIDAVWAPSIGSDNECDLTDVELIVSLGGDGTLLRAARIANHAATEVPILGLSYGHLGFLTCDRADTNVETIVGQALAGELHPSRRQTLHLCLEGQDEAGQECTREAFALNEVVLSRGGSGKIVECDVHVNGNLVTRLRGDGFVISTATGSTGYALSAGGPVVAPQTRGMVCVPLAPHTLTARAFLTAPGDIVDVAVTDGRSLDRCVFADGEDVSAGLVPLRLTVKRGERDVVLLRRDPNDFYGAVARVFFGEVR